MSLAPLNADSMVGAHPGPAQNGRDVGLDVLRGIAIAIMLGANLVPYHLVPPFPLWFRIWTSLAAPLFVFLSGYLIGLVQAAGRTRPWSYHLKRSLALLGVAIFLDLACWETRPLYHFDVLYLIALLQLVAARFAQLRAGLKWSIWIALVVLAEPLQDQVGYRVYEGHFLLEALQGGLVDGWFPVFPWLGLGLAGTHLGSANLHRDNCSIRRGAAPIAFSVAISGVLIGIITRPSLLTRGGYAELFYPPNTGVFVVALGCLPMALWSARRLERIPLARVLALFGRYSLLLYVAHVAIIARIIRPFFAVRGVPVYLASYLVMTLLMLVLAWLAMRHSPNPRGFVARMFLAH